MLLINVNEELLLVTAHSLISLVAFYYGVQAFMILKSKSQSEREKSWVLTAVTSVIMTAISLPYVGQWILTGQVVDGGSWADKTCCFFIAYLLSDLAIGSIHYRSSISVLTGWVHHTVYILLITLLVIPRSYASLFSMLCILELPTFLLAIGSLNKTLRNDYLFAGVFFATRICLHIYIAVSYALQALSPAGGSWVPTAVLTCVFPMHAMWMHNCIRGILKRRRQAYLKLAQAASVAADSVPVSAETTRIKDFQAYIFARSQRAALRSATLIRRSRQHVLRLLQDALEEGAEAMHVPDGVPMTPVVPAFAAPKWRSIRRRVVGRIRRSLPEAYEAYANGPLPAVLAATDMVEHAHRES